jgi:hypothetical protein
MEKKTELNVSTHYLLDAIEPEGGLRARHLTIRMDAGEPLTGELVVDPNACTLDNFGDTEICTLIALITHRVTFSLVQESEGKKLYAIEAEDFMGPALRLALLPRRGVGGGLLARLLVLKDDGTIDRLVNLESAERDQPAA